MNKEKILMMIKRNRDRIVIISVIFLSLLVIGKGCYSFRSPKENEKIEVKIDGLQDKIENIPEIAREDYLLFLDQLEDDEKEAFRKNRKNKIIVKRNIETLKEQKEVSVEYCIKYYISFFQSQTQDLREKFYQYRWPGVIILVASLIIFSLRRDKYSLLLVVVPLSFFIFPHVVSLLSRLLILLNNHLLLSMNSFMKRHRHCSFDEFKKELKITKFLFTTLIMLTALLVILVLVKLLLFLKRSCTVTVK